MHRGWVKLWRKKLDSRLAHDARLWFLFDVLVLQARSTPGWVSLPTLAEPVKLERGQLITGRSSLHKLISRAMPWKTPSDKTVWRWLQKLETWGKVNLLVSNRHTIVTIINYNTYNDVNSSGVQPVSNRSELLAGGVDGVFQNMPKSDQVNDQVNDQLQTARNTNSPLDLQAAVSAGCPAECPAECPTGVQPVSNRCPTDPQKRPQTRIKNQENGENEEKYALSAGADEIDLKHAERKFVDRWNSTPGVVQNRGPTLTSSRRAAFRVRMKDQDWRDSVEPALQKFPLRCSTGGGWKPDMDWILEPDSLTKILEGKYDWSKSDGKSTRSGAYDSGDSGDRAYATDF